MFVVVLSDSLVFNVLFEGIIEFGFDRVKMGLEVVLLVVYLLGISVLCIFLKLFLMMVLLLLLIFLFLL